MEKQLIGARDVFDSFMLMRVGVARVGAWGLVLWADEYVISGRWAVGGGLWAVCRLWHKKASTTKAQKITGNNGFCLVQRTNYPLGCGERTSGWMGGWFGGWVGGWVVVGESVQQFGNTNACHNWRHCLRSKCNTYNIRRSCHK